MEREITRAKREPVKEEKGKDKKFGEIRKKMFERFLEGRGTGRYFFDMYKMLPEEEREEIKKGIAFTKLSEQKKKESLGNLETLDRDAVQWWERTKGRFRELTKKEWKEWEEIMKNWEKEVEAAKKAADELTEKEQKMEKLPEAERLKLLLKEMALTDPHRLRGIVKRLEEVGITKGPEKEILEEIEGELAEKRKTEQIFYFQKREIPFLVFAEPSGTLLQYERITVKETPPERHLTELYKWKFREENLGKGARKEEVDYKELLYKRYKEAMEEVEIERR